MQLRRWVLAAAALVLLSACRTTEPVAPAASAGVQVAAEDEQRLIREGNALEDDLREKGLVLEDPALQRYVDRVGERLIPRGATPSVPIHFLILREPTINAFSLPNGAICVHEGLLVRLDNEAQFAHVLAHEISHVILRHHLKYTRSTRKKILAAKITQISTIGIGSGLIEATYAAAITGYGRETEQEADLQGLRLVAAAGYDVNEVPGLFARLNEMEEGGALETFLYSDHPSNNDRSEYTRRLIRSGAVSTPSGARLGTEEYRAATGALAADNIELRLANAHYQFALQEAQAAIARNPKDPVFQYLAGEAHRSMAEDPLGAAREEAIRRRGPGDATLLARHRARVQSELAEAQGFFEKALTLDPTFARAHRGLGLVAWRTGRIDDARRELEAYLAQGGKIPDRRYIRRVIQGLGT